MKQKNSNLFFYIIGAIILCGIVFVAVKDITPQQTHVEQPLSVKK